MGQCSAMHPEPRVKPVWRWVDIRGMAVGSQHGRGDWRRFILRFIAVAIVSVPLSFALGYAAGGVATGIGTLATTTGCLQAGALAYALRYLRA